MGGHRSLDGQVHRSCLADLLYRVSFSSPRASPPLSSVFEKWFEAVAVGASHVPGHGHVLPHHLRALHLCIWRLAAGFCVPVHWFQLASTAGVQRSGTRSASEAAGAKSSTGDVTEC